MAPQASSDDLQNALSELEDGRAFRKARTCAVVIFGARLFAMGIELSVIIPTLWPYVEELNGTPLFMGVIEGAYAVGSMVAYPVCGVIYDRTKKAKEIILVLNSLQIAGNLLYAVPVSKWCLLFGRLMAGFGDSFAACYLGELTYVFSPKRRIGIISIISMGKILGVMTGPGFNFGITNVSFAIGAWRFSKHNFAGFLMAVIWTVIQIACILSKLNLARLVIDKSNSLPRTDIAETDFSMEKDSLLETHEFDEDIVYDIKQERPKQRSHILAVLKEFASIEFVVLFFADSAIMIAYFGNTILVPLIVERDFHWSQELTSLLYIAAGGEVIFIFLMIFFLGHRYPIRDTSVVALGLVFMALAMVGLTLEEHATLMKYKLLALVLNFIFATASSALGLIACKTLITKTLKAEWQGVAHGIYSSAMRLAFITGPIAGGAAYYNRTIYSSVLCGFCFLMTFLLQLVKKRFHMRQDELDSKESASKT